MFDFFKNILPKKGYTINTKPKTERPEPPKGQGGGHLKNPSGSTDS